MSENQNNTSLWPDDIFQAPKLRPPRLILEEQGAILGEKTNNVVKGEVSSDTRPNTAFSYSFFIIAPGIRYKYRLLQIQHSIEFYPVTIIVSEEIKNEVLSRSIMILSPSGGDFTASDEKTLMYALGLIFNSTKARNVLLSFLSLDESETNEDIPF